MKTLFCAILMLCLGCHTLSETERLKSDLIGHSTGGQEKSWRFQSVDQIKSLTVDKRVGNTWFLSLILHDPRATGTWLARVKVDYAGNCVQTVGLIYLEKIQ